ncbi:MAG: hypothetical protein ACC652_16070 [Acidimicrobiales bacterium]
MNWIGRVLALALIVAAYTSAAETPTTSATSEPETTTTSTRANVGASTAAPTATVPTSAQSTSTTSSPYSGCAEYRQRLNAVEYIIEGNREAGRIREVLDEKRLAYPSPNDEGVQLSLDEALEIGRFLHVAATAQAIREIMEEVAQEPPPQPVQTEHARLVKALYEYAEAELDYAVEIYPTTVYGDHLGSPPSSERLADLGDQVDSAYFGVEDAWRFGILLCPDP